MTKPEVPPALREALKAPFKSEIEEHDGETWRSTGRFADCPPDSEQVTDRARTMAAALRWAFSPCRCSPEDNCIICNTIAALDAEGGTP